MTDRKAGIGWSRQILQSVRIFSEGRKYVSKGQYSVRGFGLTLWHGDPDLYIYVISQVHKRRGNLVGEAAISLTQLYFDSS